MWIIIIMLDYIYIFFYDSSTKIAHQTANSPARWRSPDSPKFIGVDGV